MIVVADTSTLNDLVLTQYVHLLPKQFGSVLIPKGVYQELIGDRAPEAVRRFVLDAPAWLQVVDAAEMHVPPLADLGLGEREAIQVAVQRNVGLVLMDEAKGRSAAKAFGLQVQGTLGILERAASVGLCDFPEALRRLESTNFRMSRSVRAEFLDRNR